MDDIDRAQDFDLLRREAALAEDRRRRAPAPALAAMGDSTLCADCGFPIPEARRRAVPGCRRCADCQADFEGTR